MIALTQEKREELIEYAKEVLVGHEQRGGDIDEKDIFKIALASLTACPVLYAVDSDVEDKIYTALCNGNEDGAYPLFTAPTAPEIKLPEHLTVSEIGVDEFTSGRIHGWNECLAEIKRLNGLGD